MAVSTRHLIGVLVSTGVLLITVGLVCAAVGGGATPSMAYSDYGATALRFTMTKEVKDAYYDVLYHHGVKYAVYNLVDGKYRTVTTAGPSGGSQSEDWAAFLEQLPEDDCRYGVFDFDYTPAGWTSGSSKPDKIVLVTSRLDCEPRKKMDVVYGTQDLLITFPTVDVAIRAKQKGDLEYDKVKQCVEDGACAPPCVEC